MRVWRDTHARSRGHTGRFLVIIFCNFVLLCLQLFLRDFFFIFMIDRLGLAPMNALDEIFEQLLLNSDEDTESGNEVDIPVLPIVDSEEKDIEDEEESDKEEEKDNIWSSVIIPHDHIPFSSVKDDFLFQLKEPAEFFCYFLNKDVVDLILTETNRYGRLKKIRLNLSMKQNSGSF